MNRFRRLAKATLILGLLASPAVALAQAYGQGIYGAGVYGAKTISLGPIGPIPITGASVAGFVAAVCLSMAVGLVVWTRQRRKAKLESS